MTVFGNKKSLVFFGAIPVIVSMAAVWWWITKVNLPDSEKEPCILEIKRGMAASEIGN